MELIWATGLRERLRTALLRHSPNEYGGAVLAGVENSDSGHRFLAIEFELPSDKEVSAQHDQALVIDPLFWARTAKMARRLGLTLLPVHTHPFSRNPSFSAVDTAGEKRLLPVLARMTNRPTAAIVVGTEREALGGWANNGRRLLGNSRDIGIAPTRSINEAVTVDARFSRQVRAFGEEGQHRIGALRVAVVGASGIGSHVCEQLIRLGVGEILVVDPDVVEVINLNRIVTAFAEDARSQRSKVSAVESYGRMVEGPTTVTPVQGSVLDPEVAEALGRVDAIVGCTDTIASRALLNRIAVQRFIPYWDCGTEVSSGGPDLRAFGRVRLVLAGGPCLVCMDVIDSVQLRIELLPPEERARERRLGYVRDQEVAAPAVVSLNGVTASLAAMSFLRWAVGEVVLEPGQWVYRAFAGDVRLQAAPRRADCPVCSETARLGRSDLSVAL